MTDISSRFDARAIDASLVRRLIAAQFPRWADLPISAAEPQGWDNRTFRLGRRLCVRLPSAARYVAQVEKEQAWLPKLAGCLPFPIPAPVALGAPGEGYPWPWSVYRWLPGVTARKDPIDDPIAFAGDVAQFLQALQRVEPDGGPPAGPHSFWRGGPLSIYEDEVRSALAGLDGLIDVRGAADAWSAALSARWVGPDCWVHGDIAANNLLLSSAGRLSAVLDFGCSAVGDPACDLVIAWTFFEGDARQAFREAMALDQAIWTRARGWALWKALIILARSPDDAGACGQIVETVIAEHGGLG